MPLLQPTTEQERFAGFSFVLEFLTDGLVATIGAGSWAYMALGKGCNDMMSVFDVIIVSIDDNEIDY